MDRWIGTALGFLLVVAWSVSVDWHRVLRGQNDFLQFYCGAVLAPTPDFHSAPANQALQRQITGMSIPSVATFIRPDYYAVLLRPLAWLPFPFAYALFQLAMAGCLAGFLWLERGRGVAWLTAVSIPLATSFINGQDVPLLLLFVALFLHYDRQDKPIPAGVALALCTIKFHFFLFVPLVLLLWRRWRTIAAAISTIAGLYLLAALVRGFAWPIDYWQALKNPALHPEPYQFMNARGVAIAAGGGLWIVTALGVLAVFVFLMRGRNAGFATAIAMCLAGGIYVSYHLGIQDCALLLLVFAVSQHRWLRWGAALLSTPPAYLLLMLNGWAGAIPALGLTLVLCATAAAGVPAHAGRSEAGA